MSLLRRVIELLWPRRKPKMRNYVPPPPSPEATLAQEALEKAPGPSPWYLVREGNQLKVEGDKGQYRWDSAPERPESSGKTFLRDPAERIVAVAGFYCWACSIPGDLLVMWTQQGRDGGPASKHQLVIRAFRLSELAPFKDNEEAVRSLAANEGFMLRSPPVAELVISTSLPDGTNAVSVPPILRGLGEVLFPVHSTANERRSNFFDQMHLRLWILDTATGALEIVPQDWFNSGPYDFGYQWVTRYARALDGTTIYGEGIRLGIFKLDSTHRLVDSWLAQDMFYHPER